MRATETYLWKLSSRFYCFHRAIPTIKFVWVFPHLSWKGDSIIRSLTHMCHFSRLSYRSVPVWETSSRFGRDWVIKSGGCTGSFVSEQFTQVSLYFIQVQHILVCVLPGERESFIVDVCTCLLLVETLEVIFRSFGSGFAFGMSHLWVSLTDDH